MIYTTTTVISQKKLASDIFLLEVSRPDCGDIKPGQFFMLKAWFGELTLMRPISVFKTSDHSISFMYRKAGQGTERLTRLRKGNSLQIMGALGNGFPIETIKGKIALVGGGIGIPPLYETALELRNHGATLVDAYLGFKQELFAIDDFASVAHHVFIANEQGKEGYQGFVTDLLHPENYDYVLTCGPEIMMMKVLHMCREHNIPCYLSMEKHMGCGIGACLVCSCKTKSGVKRACKDGPVFSGDDIE